MERNIIENEINNTLLKLANLYENIEQYSDAIYCYKKILKSLIENSPQIYYLYYQIATNYFKNEKYDKALDYYNKLINTQNITSDLHSMIACCYVNLKEYEKALCVLHNFNTIVKDNINIYKMLGEIYYYIKKYEMSIKYYSKSNDKYAISPVLLATKDFKKGFEFYQDRLKKNELCHQTKLPLRQNINLPDWDGTKKCKKLLIVYEQGIGDNIMYFRFLIELAKKYPEMKITYFCKNIVSHILKTDCKNVLITHDTSKFNIPSFDYKCFIMSLPYVLKKEKIDVNTINYINYDSKISDYWNKKLKSDKPKIGLFYKGLLKSSIDKIIKFNNLKKIFELDVEIICLHKKEEITEDMKFFSNNVKIFDIDTDKAFVDTIGILQNIDLLITIDSGIVHLAGVMNIPTFLLLGYVSEWRWFDNNEKIWYNSVDIYHTKENKDILENSENIIEDIKKKIICK